jgi:hypothetical protein
MYLETSDSDRPVNHEAVVHTHQRAYPPPNFCRAPFQRRDIHAICAYGCLAALRRVDIGFCRPRQLQLQVQEADSVRLGEARCQYGFVRG